MTVGSRPRPALPNPPVEGPPPGQNLLVTNFDEVVTDYEIGLSDNETGWWLIGGQAESVTVLLKVTQACVGW